MRMKRILTAVALVMAVLTVGSSAWAFDQYDHVSVAPNGKGDVLIYPIYVAAEGWENRLTVINTSNECVVAKLVVRSYVFSEELLDFLIFLSPYDMWIGTIQYGANGPEVFSTDSSALYQDINASSAPFATAENPLKQKLVAPTCPNDSAAIGYVEVIEAWSGTVAFGTSASDKQKRGKLIYDAYFGASFPSVTLNALVGSMDMNIPTLGMTASAEALTLKDYDNQDRLTTGQTTYLGENARNNTREIEAALSKNSITFPFVNSAEEGTSFHIMTFPTKLSKWAVQTDGSCKYDGSRGSKYFPSQKVGYAIRAFDNEEQTTGSPFSPARNLALPNEVNIVGVSDLVFKRGWLEVVLPNPPAITSQDVNVSNEALNYTGAPVIPMVIDIRDGLSMRYAAYSDGVVSVDGTVRPGYHYSMSYAVTRP